MVQLAGRERQQLGGRPIGFTRKCEENLGRVQLLVRAFDRAGFQAAECVQAAAPFDPQRVQRPAGVLVFVVALDPELSDLVDPLVDFGPELLAQRNKIVVLRCRFCAAVLLR